MFNTKQLLRCEMSLLVCLHVLLEERSVSRTAERLCLTQSAVSKQLSRLRELFEDPLFERTSKGLLMTPKTLALAPRVEQILSAVELLTVPAHFEPEKSKRVFSMIWWKRPIA